MSNTGQIYVGDDTVSATNPGIELDSGDAITISAPPGTAISMGDVYLDSSVSTDGVWVMWLEQNR